MDAVSPKRGRPMAGVTLNLLGIFRVCPMMCIRTVGAAIPCNNCYCLFRRRNLRIFTMFECVFLHQDSGNPRQSCIPSIPPIFVTTWE